MKHKNPPIPVLIVLVLLITALIVFGIRELIKKPAEEISVSGTIEAVNITLAAEISGKVAEVFVIEGQSVSAGDKLLRLDDALLLAQMQIAEASLKSAQAALNTAEAAAASAAANYQLSLAAARTEAAPIRTSDWQPSSIEGYTIPGGTFTQEELISAAQAEVDTAAAARDEAASTLETLLTDADNTEFVEFEQKLLTARFALMAAQDTLNRAIASDNTWLKDAAQSNVDQALSTLEDAQKAYDALLNTESAENILTARAVAVQSQEQLDAAKDRLLLLQTGEYSLKVLAAKSAADQANAAVEQAHQAILVAQSNLDLVQIQLSKLDIVAPVDSVVITCTVQPGEIMMAGAGAITLADLRNLELTVYIPEDLFGQISLGQEAAISVDSYPNQTFSGTVVQIADQAEFTPRNVQTVEGRKTTVFAVKLQVENPDLQLKAGMPADVVFSQ